MGLFSFSPVQKSLESFLGPLYCMTQGLINVHTGQFGSVKPFCYIILAIHPKLMCKVLSGSANHHRRLPDHSTSGDKLVKSGHWSSLTSSSLPPQFWESTHGVPWLFPVPDSGNTALSVRTFTSQTPEAESSRMARNYFRFTT